MAFLQNKKNFFLTVFTILIAIINLLLIIYVAPLNDLEGWGRKIFYYHVPLAWNASLAFVVCTYYSLVFLKTKNKNSDIKAMSWAESGTIYALLVVVTGPIWAKLAWGVSWRWEPRLTTTTVVILIYIAYFMIREFSLNKEKGAKLAAVISILAFTTLPLIYYSVDFWSPEMQLHPQRNNLGYGTKSIFYFSLFSFTLLLLNAVKYRVFLEKKGAK
ncbi:MAG: hypothetical protein CBD58_03150 [bacterium TMED198]|nr:MAG: hypothetical protein CBD58_03150 [bacterium TMED198]|tara:strand:+ start:280 stop:927 length:648 start_codon:yes stop_codon:yes gene_type:complete